MALSVPVLALAHYKNETIACYYKMAGLTVILHKPKVKAKTLFTNAIFLTARQLESVQHCIRYKLRLGDKIERFCSERSWRKHPQISAFWTEVHGSYESEQVSSLCECQS